MRLICAVDGLICAVVVWLLWLICVVDELSCAVVMCGCCAVVVRLLCGCCG